MKASAKEVRTSIQKIREYYTSVQLFSLPYPGGNVAAASENNSADSTGHPPVFVTSKIKG